MNYVIVKRDKNGYILCPICGKKTKTKIKADTKLKNFPLFCEWCKKETVINL